NHKAHSRLLRCKSHGNKANKEGVSIVIAGLNWPRFLCALHQCFGDVRGNEIWFVIRRWLYIYRHLQGIKQRKAARVIIGNDTYSIRTSVEKVGPILETDIEGARFTFIWCCRSKFQKDT